MQSSDMFSRTTLKSFVKKRLCAAAEEIFVVVERILTEYEEQALSSKRKIEQQQRILDVVLKPQIKLHRAEIPEKRIKKTFQPEDEDHDDEDFPGFPAVDDSSEHDDFPEEPQSPLQGEAETGWSMLRLQNMKSRDTDTVSADVTVQEDALSPEIKEEPEELLIIPQTADPSSSTTSTDRMSAVSTPSLPDSDTVSNDTTASPYWPTYVTLPAEPRPQMEVDDEDELGVVPGMDHLDRLAECLLGLRTQTGISFNPEQTRAIRALWQNLQLHDPDHGRPGGGQWPDCCTRLVSLLLGKLCDIHKERKNYVNHDGSRCYTLRWRPVLRDYNNIRSLLDRSDAGLELLLVDQNMFSNWHGQWTRMHHDTVHLQGLAIGVTAVSSGTGVASVTPWRGPGTPPRWFRR